MLEEARPATLDRVLVIDVSDELLVERVSGRYTCANCGEGYHDTFKQPEKDGVCDKCGSTEFIRRPDDNAGNGAQPARRSITTRPNRWSTITKEQGKVRVIDGDQPIEEVTQALEEAMM